MQERIKTAVVRHSIINNPYKTKSSIIIWRTYHIAIINNLFYGKILQGRIKKLIKHSNFFPKRQFGFRNAHSTIDQVHHNTAVEGKNVCTAVLLEVSEAFDKASLTGLLTNINIQMPRAYGIALTSAPQNPKFENKNFNISKTTTADILYKIYISTNFKKSSTTIKKSLLWN